ncbi:hypothetical protein F4775DRAFT_545367 [Biscogniauxia sp. FL1348]|nr:hypothetical protein F4775DRAFT_545367 [Biscogniauxia sp. FL1348]
MGMSGCVANLIFVFSPRPASAQPKYTGKCRTTTLLYLYMSKCMPNTLFITFSPLLPTPLPLPGTCTGETGLAD